MDIKNIVFDFGGVLIDWNPEYLYKGIFQDEQELTFFLHEVCNAGWNLKQDEGRPFFDGIAELSKKFPQYIDKIELYYTHWIKMIGGEIEQNTSLIKELRLSYRLFGLTNWSSETFPLVYGKYAFFKDLEGIIVSGKEKLVKPNREIYNLLLSRYGLNPEQSLFIDDSEQNIKTAQKMGFNVVHFTNSSDLKKDLEGLGLKTAHSKDANS